MSRKVPVVIAVILAAALFSPHLVSPADAQWFPRRGRVGQGIPQGRGPVIRQTPRVYREPAAARGYADGYEEGVRDARGRDRYDPVRSRDYRNADQGYYREYGSREAYRNNYRLGFRQGYDEGYRTLRRR
jgi:hypothetical protein